MGDEKDARRPHMSKIPVNIVAESSSDSESDSDDFFKALARKRKITYIAESDSYSDGSSDSSVLSGRFLSPMKNPRFTNDNDSSSRSSSKEYKKNNDEYNEDSSNDKRDCHENYDQSEKCPICLLSFTNQEIGSPETCNHKFCSFCIQEWAKNVDTCPVDRQKFSSILVRKELNGEVVKNIPITSREEIYPLEPDSEPIICEICRRSIVYGEGRLLLCDGCYMGYHLECMSPPMENVPDDGWLCPDCAGGNTSGLARGPQESDSDPIICDICRRSIDNGDGRLLLCGGCDLKFHIECLSPPMQNVPNQEWYCPDCAGNNSSELSSGHFGSESEPIICEVCRRSTYNEENRLLLCGGCNLKYHLECLNRPMENITTNGWFCPECTANNSSRIGEEV